MPHVLVTGSNGLIGSEAVVYFDRLGWTVSGLDNNMRRTFFGPEGDTRWNQQWLLQNTSDFQHLEVDIRDRARLLRVFSEHRFDFVIHCAAQPSHDLAARLPFEDWDTNASGTFNLLESARQYCAESPFVFMSTNKVYGDAPNERPLVELPTRYDFAHTDDFDGIDETCRVDQALHSLFGASKTAADIAAQEFGRYFDMPVGIFRGGCLTGAHHCGVELHGFLSYLVKSAVAGRKYTVFGHKGKQVRDNIHAGDVVEAFYQFYLDPRPGEVYNLGGGRENSTSIIEAVDWIEQLVGRKIELEFSETARRGDHICYITNLGKIRSHFPDWQLTRSLDSVLEEMVKFELAQRPAATVGSHA